MTLIACKCLGAPLLYCCSPVHRQLTNVMQKPEVQLNQNPINYGAWDTCSSAKAVPINTVMRAKREFVTPAWEREALAKLKEEGRDIASIDKDLKVREGDDGKGNLELTLMFLYKFKHTAKGSLNKMVTKPVSQLANTCTCLCLLSL